MPINELFRKKRLEKKLSQNELAERLKQLGLNTATQTRISEWENWKIPTAAYLIPIMRILDITLEEAEKSLKE